MFDPEQQISGEKAQKLEFTLLSLLRKLSEKVLKLLISLVKLPLNLLQSSRHNKSDSKSLEKSSPSQQSESMENNQKLIEQERFDKILRDRLLKKGVPDAAQKVKGFRAGHNMLFTQEEFEKFGQALDETREYIIRNPLPDRNQNSKTSATQNSRPAPPPPSTQTEIAQQQKTKVSSQPPKQEAKSISEFVALKLKDKGLSNQEINSIVVEIQEYEKAQPQQQKANNEEMLIVINDQKQHPNLSEKVKNLFEQLGQAFKQVTKTFGDMFKDKQQNFKQDLNNMSVAFTSQRLLDFLGAEDSKGNRVFETNSYKIQADSGNSSRKLSVVDKSANSIILASDKGSLGRLQGNLSKQNLRDFEKLNRQLNLAILETGKQQQQHQIKALPSPTNSLASRKNNEIER